MPPQHPPVKASSSSDIDDKTSIQYVEKADEQPRILQNVFIDQDVADAGMSPGHADCGFVIDQFLFQVPPLPPRK